MTKNTVPVWLFSSLYDQEVNGVKRQRWGLEKEELAQSIVNKIRQVAKNQYWEDSVLERVLYINRNDDINMYGITPLKSLAKVALGTATKTASTPPPRYL